MLGKGLESLIPPKPGSPSVSGLDGGSGSLPNPSATSSSPREVHYQSAPPHREPHVPAAPFTLHHEPKSAIQPASPSLGVIHQDGTVKPVHSSLVQPDSIPTYQPITVPQSARSVPRPVRNDFEVSAKNQRDEAVFQIEVDKIRPNPHQPRREFDEVALRELASSIREFGVIQPIVVTKVETESESGSMVEYELIAGERRLMASKLAGLRTVPVVVRRASTDREKLEVAIIENIQRQDLNPIETAKAFARLQDEFKLTQREIAARLGKSREAVANAVRLLHLPLEIQTAVSSGQLSESQARLLLSLSDIGEQNKLFNEIIGNKLSVREIRTRISRKKSEMEPQVAYTDPETSALRERLEEFLGTKVDLKDEGDAGRITINFYSKEELRGILQKLFHEGNS